MVYAVTSCCLGYMNKLLLVMCGLIFQEIILAADSVSLAPPSPETKPSESTEPPHKKNDTGQGIGVDNRIAIVVGKTPITYNQIDARARLMRISREPENFGKPSEALLKEATQALVGERIKRSTCERVKSTISEEEMTQHLEKLAEQNGMTVKSMEEFFVSKGIPLNTIRESIYVQMAWPRAVQSNVQVFVSDQEAQKALDEARTSFDQDRVELGEIVVYGDSPKQLEVAKKRLQSIADILAKGGSFPIVAQQSSESSSAANEGNIGWFTEGSLKAEERNAINNKPVGYCTAPLPCSGGYRILYVLDRQYPGELPLSQSHIVCTVARLPFSPEWSMEKQEIFGHMIENITQCKDEASFKEHVSAWTDTDQTATVESLKPMALHDLPPEVARLVSACQETGVVRGPLRLPNNQLVLVLIKSRVRVKGQNKITFEQVQSHLYQEKMDAAARREFAHLRSRTSIDYLMTQFRP